MSTTVSDRLRFERICAEELLSYKKESAGIGTYMEKRLHSMLKKFVCEEMENHEIKVIADSVLEGEKRPPSCIADIKCGNHVYEIQTGSLFPLRKKLDLYLNRTNNEVTIIHPLAAIKWVSWIDPDSGEITSRRKSPKKEDVTSIARDLYGLTPYLCHPRLKILLISVELEEFRYLNGKRSSDKKRGSTRYDRFPLKLVDIITLSCPNDYKAAFLPDKLPNEFTASEYAAATKIRGIATYSALSFLCEKGFLEKGEKRGRSFIYKKMS